MEMFSSPFLGTFFQSIAENVHETKDVVFVPFLGDFLSIYRQRKAVQQQQRTRFRPLSWGLSFNHSTPKWIQSWRRWFSSPFLGTFFQ